MKTKFKLFVLISLFSTVIISCKKEDEGEELSMGFKTGASYTSSNVTLEGGSDVKIGIHAETEKEKDPIIKFSISESVNGASATSVLNKDISTTSYDYDYEFTLDTVSGNTHKYLFNVTNKDGRIAGNNITITVK